MVAKTDSFKAKPMEEMTAKIVYSPRTEGKSKKGTHVKGQPYVPGGVAEKGKGSGSFRLGVRIQLQDGEWWFYSTKHQTWSRHLPGDKLFHRSGSPITDPQGVQQYGPDKKDGPWKGDDKLAATWGHVKKPFPLVETLLKMREAAEEAEAEERAERKAA